jgi:hypothetical protein
MSPPRTVLKQGTAMDPEPQTQGDARTRKHADMCNGYLSTELTKRHAKWVAPNAATAGAISIAATQIGQIGKTRQLCARGPKPDISSVRTDFADSEIPTSSGSSLDSRPEARP